MISSDEMKLLGNLAYTYDHNVGFYSLLLGEPFFDDGFLHYFDGRTLFVNTFSLYGRSVESSLGLLHGLVRRSIEAFQPEAINIWGPVPAGDILSECKDWISYPMASPQAYHRDMVLRLAGGAEKSALVSRRYAARNRIHIEIAENKAFTSRHIELIERLVRSKQMDVFDRCFWAMSGMWLNVCDSAVLFNAWRGGELIGFHILDSSLKNLPIGLLSSTLPGAGRVSNVLYGAMIEYCLHSGEKLLCLGHSYQKTLFDFKRRLGECIVQDGSFETLFCRPGVLVDPSNYTWLSRALHC